MKIFYRLAHMLKEGYIRIFTGKLPERKRIIHYL